MSKQKKSYDLGKSLAGFFEIFGWVIVVLGAVLTVMIIATGSPLSIVNVLTGVAMSISGLWAVMMSQQALATFETNVLLRGTRLQAPDGPQSAPDAETETMQSKTAILTQRGGGKVKVTIAYDNSVSMETINGTKIFENMKGAQAYIS